MSKKPTSITVTVEFAGVSVGKNTARLGVKIDRAEGLKPAQAEALFLNSRVQVKIAVADREQERLPGVSAPELDTVADIKGYHATADAFTIGLTLPKHDVDLAKLSDFASETGTLTIQRIGDAGDTDDPADNAE